jgi:Ran-binding protein 3
MDVNYTMHHAPADKVGSLDVKEDTDAATIAASEELKHTSISDKVLPVSNPEPVVHSVSIAEDKEMEEERTKAVTPESAAAEAQDEIMRERITSPKKKRGRDLDDDIKEAEEAGKEDASSSPDGQTNAKRILRSEPEKKRPRDTSIDSPEPTAKLAEAKVCCYEISCFYSLGIY